VGNIYDNPCFQLAALNVTEPTSTGIGGRIAMEEGMPKETMDALQKMGHPLCEVYAGTRNTHPKFALS
jgi:hypothetical protein